MKEITFRNLFFRYYDRKISDGTITFSSLGISKADFTRLCIEEDFLFDEDALIKICNAMDLTEEEEIELFDAADRLRGEKKSRMEYLS